MKIIGAISDIPGRAVALSQRVAAASVRGVATLIAPLFAAEGVALVAIRRPEESLDDIIAGESADGRDRFWFAGDGIAPSNRVNGAVPDVGRAVERLRTSLEGDYIGVSITGDHGVRLYTDSWGLGWIFVRRLHDGVVFASDFRAVCAVDDATLSLDRDALLLELGIGYVPDDSTVFREVTVVPPGGALQLSADGVETVARHAFEYGDAWRAASQVDKFARLDQLFEAMSHRSRELAGGPVAISLSAGIDSRYALAWLGRTGAVGPLMTFGEPDSDEVVDARKVAHRYAPSPDWSSFVVGDTSFAGWRSMIQSLGNAGIVQWCGWADDWLTYVRARATNCATGYLGDASSGKRLDVLPALDGAPQAGNAGLDQWARRWVAWEFDMGEWATSPLLRPEARARLAAAAHEHFAVAAASGRFAQPHQSAQHCNLISRQRRWVGTQTVLMSAYVKSVSFFVDRAYREFWMNVGLDDLHGQALYHRYAEERFPKLFPKPPSATAHFAQRVGRRVRRELDALAGRPRMPKRPPPIVRAKLLAPHYADILALFDQSVPALDAILDVARCRAGVEALARGNAEGLTHHMLLRAVNVMHLLKLATPSDRERQP